MMSAPTNTSPSADTRHGERLRLKPELPGRGYVDGGWWPRSRELAAELPDLLGAMCDRIGPVEMVTYHLDDWPNAPRKMVHRGVLVRIGGYRLQAQGSIDIIARERRATLLVVEPSALGPVAHAALTAASAHDNTETIPALLAHVRSAERTTESERS